MGWWRRVGSRLVAFGAMVGLVLVPTVGSAAPVNSVPVTTPAASDWQVVGGNLGNGRYSGLDQINASNVKDLNGAWVTHLGSGLGDPKYSLEDSPVVQNGVMYVASGNDDIFALDARSGQLMWEYDSGLDQSINTVCCGWDNRGVAVGDGLVFSGRLDGSMVALDQTTGQPEWQTQVGRWQDGYTITAAPTYYNGVVYTGISGGDLGVRGKVTALDGGLLFHGDPDGNFNAYDARTGNTLWSWQTGAGADAPAVTYMLDGVQYVSIAAGGTSLVTNSQRGDMIWTFTLNGKLRPFPAPKPPVSVMEFGAAPVASEQSSGC